MDEEIQDLQKSISDPMETEEGHLINENSNGLSHLLTREQYHAETAVVDESSTSNQGFMNAVELSAGSAGDYTENNTEFNAETFDVGDNAVSFPNESNNVNEFDDSQDLLQSDTNDNTKLSETVNEFSSPPDPTHYAEMSLPEIDATSTDATSIDAGSNDAVFNDPVSNDLSTQETVCIDDTSATHEVISDDGVSNDANEEPNSETPLTNADALKSYNISETKVGGAEETEIVSEDELPLVEKPKIKDAENVSDDELPGPKPADLPADTEVVSEDELPSAKKDKVTRKRKPEGEKEDYNPDSPTSESESLSKKQAVAKNGESKPIPAEKRLSVDEKPKKKVLPELDKYWKVVNDDPTDFTGWTYLLQYVDQESDVEAAREAYDAFLSHYPYCYGYWRKYADYEKRKGSKKKCNEVLERGLKGIPLSVDLWIHYLNHVKVTRPEDHDYIRSQYERAIDACGLEFRSDRLWESYIKWEAENGSALNVTNIYDRLLTTPTLGYSSHFDNFQEHVMSEPAVGVVSRSELVRLRAEVRDAIGAQPQLDLPPGEDEPDDHIASEEEGQAIKERIIAARRKIHKTTGEQVAARWTFEEGIKRPYFHVKPLERCQLKNWKAYLEWEKQHGSFKRAYVLHERCLIACALYEEFWIRLVKFLEERSESDPELISVEREVLERACTVHHLDKPDLHMYWAHFEEAQGNPQRAVEILERIEKACPNLVQIQYRWFLLAMCVFIDRRVSLERRRGDYEKCAQLYEQYILGAKNKAISSALAIKYARFLFHIRHDPSAARTVLNEAVTKDPLNQRLHLQRLDLALHTPDTPYSELEELVQSYEKQEGAELEVMAAFAWRRRDLAEELGEGGDARAAAHHQRALARLLRKRARKDKHEQPPPTINDSNKKKENSTTVGSNTGGGPTGGAGNYYPPSGAPPQSYDPAYTQNYPNTWGYPQPPGPYQHHPHPHPWPQYTNYY